MKFFRVLGKKAKNAFLHQKLKILGFIIMWMIPLLTLLYYGIRTKVYSEIKFELWAIPILLIIILLYLSKFKKWLRDQLLAARIKGVPASPFYYLVNTLFNCGTIYLIYLIFKVISSFSIGLEKYLKLCIVCIAVGGMCYILDSCNHLIDSEEKNDEKTKD